MAYSEELVRQIRIALEKFAEAFTEKEIFGGVVFLYKGKMTVGAINEDLMVRRTISPKIEEELENEHVPLWILQENP